MALSEWNDNFVCKNLMLGAFTTIDQVPALPFALAQSDAGDVSAFGGYTGGGA